MDRTLSIKGSSSSSYHMVHPYVYEISASRRECSCALSYHLVVILNGGKRMAASKNSPRKPRIKETENIPEELSTIVVAPIAIHATAIHASERQERLDMLARVPGETRIANHLTTTNYH